MQTGLPPGTRLGRFEIVRQLGHGGAGAVFLARVPGPEGFVQQLALKVLHPGPGARAALVEEAKLLQELHHGNVVRVFELGREGGLDFVAMEHVDGMSLSDLILRGLEAGLACPPGVALFIGVEVCKALHFVHTRTDAAGNQLDLVHRDISPGNILLSWAGEVKLADFGIAKGQMERRLGETEPGVVKGKLGYMGPEQAAGGVPLDARADLYSTALSLYEALTGDNPLLGGTDLETYRRCLEPSLPPPSQLRPELPAAVDEFFALALARERDARFASAAQMRRALEALPPLRELSTPDLALSEHLARLKDVLPPQERSLSQAARMALGGDATASPGARPGVPNTEIITSQAPVTVRRRRAVPAAIALAAVVVAVAFAVAGGRRSPPDRAGATRSGPSAAPQPLVTSPPPAPAAQPPSPTPVASAPRLRPVGRPARAGRAGVETAASASAAKTAVLRVNVDEPWAEVIVDGKSLGNVPRKAVLSAGPHTLTLRNPDLHMEKSIAISLAPGETRTVSEWPP